MRFRLALNYCLSVLVPDFRAPLTQPFCQLPANKALASHVVCTSTAGHPIFPGHGPDLPRAVCYGIGDPGLLSLYPTVGRKLVPVRNLFLLSWQLVFLPFFFLFFGGGCLRLFSVDGGGKPFSLLYTPWSVSLLS